MSDIKRKVELWLVAQLTALLPSIKFLPSKGGSDSEDAASITPPFCDVDAYEAKRLIQDEPTWQITASLIYVTMIDDTTPFDHSSAFQRIHDTVQSLPYPIQDQTQQLSISGLVITETGHAEDASRQSRGDSIILRIVATG